MLVLAVIACLVSSTVAQTTTVWVDASSGDDTHSGSESLPFSTINRALDEAALFNDATIRVLTGTYDWAHEDAYTGSLGTPRDPFPLVINRDNVTLEGVETVLANYPRVGGGVAVNGAEALVLIDATTSDRSNITITGLWLQGEDVTGEDAPAALLVEAESGYTVADTVSFGHNICKRPVQNESGSAGLATLTIRARDASVQMVIEYNEIEASERGAIEFLAEAGEDETVSTRSALLRNRLEVPEDESALFGLRWSAAGVANSYGNFTGLLRFDGNILESGWSPGDTTQQGFVNGFEVLCPEFTNFTVMNSFSADTITGCRGDGVLLSADGDNSNAISPNITIIDFDRNQIVKNGGSGIVLEWDKGGGHAGAGYIFPALQSNLIAGNVEYGILFTGLGTASSGSVPIVNATIADNGLAGLGFEGLCTGGDAPDSGTIEQTFGEQRNNILWFNNAEGDQITGLGGLTSDFTDLFQHCNMQETVGVTLPGGQGNISADPLFVSYAPRDWHISANSPCIDAGYNGPVSVSKDMDDDDRIQDSDFDCEGVPRPLVDIGADEVPQPECE